MFRITQTPTLCGATFVQGFIKLTSGPKNKIIIMLITWGRFICLKCQSCNDFYFSVNNTLYTGKGGFSHTPCNIWFVVLLQLKNISLTDLYNSSHATCKYVSIGFKHSIFSIIGPLLKQKSRNRQKRTSDLSLSP